LILVFVLFILTLFLHRKMKSLWLLITVAFVLKKCTRIQASIPIAINYDSAHEAKSLPRFWTNLGFSPALEETTEFLKSSDVHLNLEIIGSLPNKGLRNVRIHWLLDLLKIMYENLIFEELHDLLMINFDIYLQIR
jgi:hypothetical protein